MGKKYTQQALGQFFEEFKNLPIPYRMENVLQLLNNPEAKPHHWVNFHINHVKYLITGSLLIIGISALLYIISAHQKEELPLFNNKEQIEPSETETAIIHNKNNSDKTTTEIKAGDSKRRLKIMKKENQKISESIAPLNSKFKSIQSDSADFMSTIENNELTENRVTHKNIAEEERAKVEVPIISLTKDEMKNLGFKFYRDSVVYIFKDGCNKYISSIDSIDLDFNADSSRIIDEDYLPLMELEEMRSQGKTHLTIKRITTEIRICGKMSLKSKTEILLRAVTDIHSKFIKQIWSYDEDMIDGYYPDMNEDDIDFNLLVPVKCITTEPDLGLFDIHVFWIYPNERLFDCLPERLSEQLKQEFNLLISTDSLMGRSESSCTFYEMCKSTLLLKEFKIYPNPAIHSATIEFYAPEALEGSVSLVTIAGAGQKALIPNTSFMAGHNRHKIDLSGITPGIYLILINSNRGFKTQRLIVSP